MTLPPSGGRSVWHKQFIEPIPRNADLILPHGAAGPAVDIITTEVMNWLG